MVTHSAIHAARVAIGCGAADPTRSRVRATISSSISRGQFAKEAINERELPTMTLTTTITARVVALALRSAGRPTAAPRLPQHPRQPVPVYDPDGGALPAVDPSSPAQAEWGCLPSTSVQAWP